MEQVLSEKQMSVVHASPSAHWVSLTQQPEMAVLLHVPLALHTSVVHGLPSAHVAAVQKLQPGRAVLRHVPTSHTSTVQGF